MSIIRYNTRLRKRIQLTLMVLQVTWLAADLDRCAWVSCPCGWPSTPPAGPGERWKPCTEVSTHPTTSRTQITHYAKQSAHIPSHPEAKGHTTCCRDQLWPVLVPSLVASFPCPSAGVPGWRWYYRRYIDVRKGGIGGVSMLLAGYCVLSYVWSYPHISKCLMFVFSESVTSTINSLSNRGLVSKS